MRVPRRGGVLRVIPSRATLALVLSAACGSEGREGGGPSPAAFPDPAMNQPVLEFAVAGADSGQGPFPSAEVRAEGDALVVEGRLQTPDPCRRVEGALRREGGAWVLEVSVRRDPAAEMCVQVLGAFAYRAVVTGLPEGEVRIRAVHTYPDAGWPDAEVLDRTVRVR